MGTGVFKQPYKMESLLKVLPQNRATCIECTPGAVSTAKYRITGMADNIMIVKKRHDI